MKFVILTFMKHDVLASCARGYHITYYEGKPETILWPGFSGTFPVFPGSPSSGSTAYYTGQYRSPLLLIWTESAQLCSSMCTFLRVSTSCPAGVS